MADRSNLAVHDAKVFERKILLWPDLVDSEIDPIIFKGIDPFEYFGHEAGHSA